MTINNQLDLFPNMPRVTPPVRKRAEQITRRAKIYRCSDWCKLCRYDATCERGYMMESGDYCGCLEYNSYVR